MIPTLKRRYVPENSKLSIVDKNLYNSAQISLYSHQQTLAYQFKKVKVFQGGKQFFIDIQNINHIKADGNYSHLFLTNGIKYIAAKSLKQIESEINCPYFIRCHQSYLINSNYIRFMDHKENELCVGEKLIPISRRQRKSLQGSMLSTGILNTAL